MVTRATVPIFWLFFFVGFGSGLRVDKKSTFLLKKVAVPLTLEPKKWGLPLTPIKLFASAGAHELRPGRPEPRERRPTRTILWGLGLTPHFFGSRVRGTATFFSENVDFLAETQVPSPQKQRKCSCSLLCVT